VTSAVVDVLRANVRNRFADDPTREIVNARGQLWDMVIWRIVASRVGMANALLPRKADVNILQATQTQEPQA
jgi:hypothetical protein